MKKVGSACGSIARMAIRAVIFDVGGVLEIIDDTVFPGEWPSRLDLTREELDGRLATPGGDAVLGELTEAEIEAHWQRSLGLTAVDVERLVNEFWRWYVGSLDRELFDWFVARRRGLLTGLLSNSGPGAREREACWGFEAVTDDIVYSHEVGLKRPDPAIFALAGRRLHVEPHEILFLDDVSGHVAAARAAG